MKQTENTDLALMPASADEIERVRAHCRSMVRKRAAISAGVAAVPVPVVDIVADMATFALLVDEINKAFGLTPAQIERLNPRMRVMVYETAAAIGSMLVGKLITRGLVLRLFRRSGFRIATKTVAKLVPLAGQIVSAAIGFTLFKKMGEQHIDACVKVVRELSHAQPA